jgi:hypothetical protein
MANGNEQDRLDMTFPWGRVLLFGRDIIIIGSVLICTWFVYDGNKERASEHRKMMEQEADIFGDLRCVIALDLWFKMTNTIVNDFSLIPREYLRCLPAISGPSIKGK